MQRKERGCTAPHPRKFGQSHTAKEENTASRKVRCGGKKKGGRTNGWNPVCEGLGFWRTARRQRKASQNDAEGKSTFNMLKEMVMIEKRGKKKE